MIRYTVVWHRLAEDELVEIWASATDRAGVTRAANSIDSELAVEPEQKGNRVSTRSCELTIEPLQILYRVRVADRVVEVFSVARV